MLFRSLTRAAGYFIHDVDFKYFRTKAPQPPKEVCRLFSSVSFNVTHPPKRSTCSNFGAMEYGKYKGNITGIVAFLCRHMLVLPGGIINLHGGEK